ncbi:MAG: tetratricopeptide repeat protein, partial [Planctomycetes bacterium]|nr:tetratricopeptide repeat protein [Planctomycetota bacterium]
APSAAYQLRKLISRHKVPFAFLVAFFVLVTGAAIWTNALRAQAAAEAETAKQISDFLVGLFRVSSPYEARGNEVTAREIIDKGAEKIEQELADQPELQARLMLTIGKVYKELGLYDRAYALLQRALEIRQNSLDDDHVETLVSLGHLASLLRLKGKLSGAEEAMRRALEGHRRARGEDHPTTLSLLTALANVLTERGKYSEAEDAYRRALERRRRTRGDDNRGTMTTMANLGNLLRLRGNYSEAEVLFRKTLDYFRRELSPDDPNTLAVLNKMGALLRDQGKSSEAEALHRPLLESCRRVRGVEHPATLAVLKNLARDVADQGRLEEAEELFEELMATAARELPPDHWHLGVFAAYYGECLTKLERYVEAEQQLVGSSKLLKEALGGEHRYTVEVINFLVNLYEAWGKPEEAAEYRAMLPR